MNPSDMKAIVLTNYGSSEMLQLKNVAKPQPKPNEVFVRIKATAINDYDWSYMRGQPYIYRLMFGITKPKRLIPGMEMSGVVEELGATCTRFQVGDEVYGDVSDYGFGTFAEYICVNEKALTAKPHSMSFDQAASIPHAALLAAQGLRDVGNIRKGQKILINGAGGGVGTFGLQIAKSYDAEVTGVDTGDKMAMMQELGFDHIVDYKKTDFTKMDEQYDLILDAKTNRSPLSYTRCLKPNGTYVTVGGHLNKLLQILFYRRWISWFHKKDVCILALKPNQGLEYIHGLFEAGKIKCMIDGPHQLEDIPDLIDYFGAGKHIGKVIVSVG